MTHQLLRISGVSMVGQEEVRCCTEAGNSYWYTPNGCYYRLTKDPVIRPCYFVIPSHNSIRLIRTLVIILNHVKNTRQFKLHRKRLRTLSGFICLTGRITIYKNNFHLHYIYLTLVEVLYIICFLPSHSLSHFISCPFWHLDVQKALIQLYF